MPKKYIHEDFLKVANLNPTITLIGKYEGMDKKIEFECNICKGRDFKVANDLKKGIGCKYCARTQTSFSENFILLALKVAGIIVLHRNKTIIDYELDIYLPDYKIAIEPGSWNFHKKKFDNDLLKQNECKRKGIYLLIIYDSFDTNDLGIVQQFDFIKTYPKCLSSETDCGSLKVIVHNILQKIHFDYSFSEKEWDLIKNEAQKHSRRITVDEFKKKLNAFRKDIELYGELGRNQSDPAEFKCVNCGYIWTVAPVSVMRKDRPTGCPKCGGTQLKNHQEFVDELKTILQDIVITGTYEKSDIKIGYKCLVCGHKGIQYPSRLLEGIGCKKCSNNKKSQMQTKSHDDFVREISEKNSNIEIIGEYTHNKKKIMCKCKVCYTLFESYAGDLLRGHGCEKCARKANAQKRQKPVKCTETGQIYSSLKDAQSATGINGTCISNVCKGKQQQAGGYTWIYIDKETN